MWLQPAGGLGPWLALGVAAAGAGAWLGPRLRRASPPAVDTGGPAARNLAALGLSEAHDAALLLDGDGRLEAWNPAALALLGPTLKHHAGTRLSDLTLPAERARLAHAVKRARKSPDGSRFTGVLALPHAEQPILHWLLTPVPHLENRLLAVGRDVTTLWETVDALRESEQRLKDVMNTVADAIVVVDEYGVIQSANRAAERIFGHVAETVIGQTVDVLLPCPRPEEPDTTRCLQEELALAVGRNTETMGLRADGVLFPADMMLSDLIHDGRHYYTAIIRDLSERQQAQARLRVAAKVLDATQEGVAVTGADRHVQWVNNGFSRITGHAAEATVDRSLPALLHGDGNDGSGGPFESIWQKAEDQDRWSGEVMARRHNGERVPLWFTLQTLRDPADRVEQFVAVFSDISRTKEAEAKIHSLTYYDNITRLPNYTLLHDRMVGASQRSDRTGRKVALALVGLDRFKHINESLGHPVGDAVLAEVAKRLKAVVRSPDTVGRLSGDVFCCILTDLQETRAVTATLDKVVRQFQSSFMLHQHEIFITVSIGASFYPDDALTMEDLIHRAETAMARSKDETDSTYYFYQPEMNVAADAGHRLKLETELRKALRRDEMELYYQPKVSLSDNRLVGAEALIRWKHPVLGMVSPGKFIPIAEETGLIASIGDWVITTACAQIRTWREAQLPLVPIAVNLSAQQFRQGDLVDCIYRAVEEVEIPPGLLELELTETAVMENAEVTIAILGQLHERGHSIAVDDFGTGYSSLSYLKRFPLNRLKIDRSFVQDLTTSPTGAEIVSAIIRMAHSLNLAVVAEGVETADQLAQVKSLGCEDVQGFYFGRPVPAEDFAALMKQNAPLVGHDAS